MTRLSSILRRKYPGAHKRLIWIDSKYRITYPVPYLSEWFVYIWKEKHGDKEVYKLIKRIRFAELMLFFSILFYLIIFWFLTSG